MKANRLIGASLLLTLLISTPALMAEPMLNGMAINTELNKERFIAALYSDNLSDNADTILNSVGDRRMELKVTDERLSARSLNSMWIEGMAINNRSADLEAQAENLAKLTNMVRRRLVEGDTLRLDAVQGQGTTVSLNGVELGNIADDAFFPLLLRTWIGSVPLSSAFKADLLAGGEVDRALADRYSRLGPDESRVAAVSTWTTPTPDGEGAAAASAAATTVAVAPPPDLDIPAPGTPAEPEPEPEPAAPEPEQAATSAPVQPEPPPEPEPEPQQTVARAPAPAAPAPDDDEEEQEAFSAQSLLQRQYFVSNSLIAIRRAVKYPRRALERAQEGSVRLAVTIDRTGELMDVQPVEESRHSLLNRAATRAVENAKFEPIPASVMGDSITFTAPITFNLQ